MPAQIHEREGNTVFQNWASALSRIVAAGAQDKILHVFGRAACLVAPKRSDGGCAAQIHGRAAALPSTGEAKIFVLHHRGSNGLALD
jgi:hypothetical protein